MTETNIKNTFKAVSSMSTGEFNVSVKTPNIDAVVDKNFTITTNCSNSKESYDMINWFTRNFNKLASVSVYTDYSILLDNDRLIMTLRYDNEICLDIDIPRKNIITLFDYAKMRAIVNSAIIDKDYVDEGIKELEASVFINRHFSSSILSFIGISIIHLMDACIEFILYDKIIQFHRIE